MERPVDGNGTFGEVCLCIKRELTITCNSRHKLLKVVHAVGTGQREHDLAAVVLTTLAAVGRRHRNRRRADTIHQHRHEQSRSRHGVGCRRVFIVAMTVIVILGARAVWYNNHLVVRVVR